MTSTMVEDLPSARPYPVESSARTGTTTGSASPSSLPSSAARTPPTSSLQVATTPGIDTAASKVHHLHVGIGEDDVKRSLRFMHGGGATDSTTGSSSLTASAKRVVLGDGDQRMYRHRASVANVGKGASSSSTPTRKGHRSTARTPRADGTTIINPLTVEVMEIEDTNDGADASQYNSTAASPQQHDRGYASSAASPMGRSRIATAAPAKPRGQRLCDDAGEEEEEEEEGGARDADNGYANRDRQRESIFSEDASSPIWQRGPRKATPPVPATTLDKPPLLHRSPQQLSLNVSLTDRISSGAADPLFTSDVAPDVHAHRNQRDSLVSEDANSPVWHRSPRADAPLTPVTDKLPLLHRSPQELSLNASLDRNGTMPVPPPPWSVHDAHTDEAAVDQPAKRLSQDASSPIWHRSPRLDSLEVSQLGTQADHHHRGGGGGATGVEQSSHYPSEDQDARREKKAPIIHQSPRESALQPLEYSSAVEVTSRTASHGNKSGDGAKAGDDADDAGSPVWAQQQRSRDGKSTNADALDASLQSARKAPIMHVSPAASRQMTPLLSSQNGSFLSGDAARQSLRSDSLKDTSDNTKAARLPTVPQPPSRPNKTATGVQSSPQSTRKSASPKGQKQKPPRAPSTTAALPAVRTEGARKPAVPRFPKRKASQEHGMSACQASPEAHATQDRRHSDDERLDVFVRRFNANNNNKSNNKDNHEVVPNLPTVLPTETLYTDAATTVSGPSSPSYPQKHRDDPLDPVVAPNGTVQSSGLDQVGESLLDQILRRNRAATSGTTLPTTATSLTGYGDGGGGSRRPRMSGSHNSALTSDYRRSYDLTAADSLHSDRPRGGSSTTSGGGGGGGYGDARAANSSSHRAHAMSSTSWKVASRAQGKPTVQTEKMDCLVPVAASSVVGKPRRGDASGAASSSRGASSTREPSARSPHAATTNARAAPLPAIGAGGASPRRGESTPVMRSNASPTKTTTTTTALPALGLKTKPPLPASARGRGTTTTATAAQPHNADGSPTAHNANSPNTRRAAPDLSKSKYADSPYLQSAVEAQRQTRASALVHKQRQRQKVNRVQRAAPRRQAAKKNTKAAKPRQERMSYAEILKAEDRYGHILTHHGF